MITDDQITALAREYAEEYTKKKYPNVPGHVRERIVEGRLEHMEDFIPWLLRRFCLVEKSCIQEEFREAKSFLDVATPLAEIEPWSYYTGRKIALNHLFPNIAKEVEG